MKGKRGVMEEEKREEVIGEKKEGRGGEKRR